MRTGRPPKAPKVIFTCEQCGNEWQAYAWQTNDRSKYCSRRCFHLSQVGKPREIDKLPEQRKCIRCGKIFLVGGEGNKRSIAKYCSRTCAKHGYWGNAVHKPARQMQNDEAIWFAGLFDGEGCIAWPRRPLIHSVRLDLTSTNEPIIQRVITITGTGKVTAVVRTNKRHSPCWRWQCYGDNARSLLQQILPWLIIKREAAEVALGINKATEPPWTLRTRTIRSAQ